MTTLEALRSMLEGTGMTPYRLAMLMHRDSAYISGMLRRGSCPSADLLAEMARACGYSLELVPDGDGESITIGDAKPD